MNLLEELKETSRKYAPVPFYWWNGDKLEKERLSSHLDQLAEKGVGGVNVNYIHKLDFSQEKGEPPLFSKEWWELWKWFVSECDKRGMSAGFDDYLVTSPAGTIGKQLLREHPELMGYKLDYQTCRLEMGEQITVKVPEGTVFVAAIARNGEDSRQLDENSCFHPERQGWSVTTIFYSRQGGNALNPAYAESLVERWLKPYEEANPDQMGKGVNFFFQDEVNFHLEQPFFTPEIFEVFADKKGYDVKPFLDALFVDIGNLTEKVRLEYYEVALDMLDTNYFKTICGWMQQRGILIGCDNNSRGDVEQGFQHYIDYFRTTGNYSAPGAEDSGPASNRSLYSGKVSSSIAHLYNRPRTWVEGYHSCGWGVTPQQLIAFTNENFVFGYNLLNLHGLYYSTHGGWFEWAPPDFHFRQPFWNAMGDFNLRVARLSNLLTMGTHRADVAIYYPASSAQAGVGARQAADTARELGEFLFRHGIDFDYIDDYSLQQATVTSQGITAGKETYRYLLLPQISVIRFSVFEKIREYAHVIAYRSVPSISDRIGRNDPLLKENQFLLCQNREQLLSMLEERDFHCDTPDIFVLHRQIENMDVYAIHNANEEDREITIRCGAKGTPVLLDILTLHTEPVPSHIHFAPKEMKLVVYGLTGQQPVDCSQVKKIPLDGDWEFRLSPTLDNRYGDFRLNCPDKVIGAEARAFLYSEDGKQWEKVIYSDGPRFVSGEEQICFSEKLGIIKDPHLNHWLTGPHGLKCKTPDEFLDITMDEPGSSKTIESYVVCAQDEKRFLITGSRGGYRVFVNDKLAAEQPPLELPEFIGLPEYISPVCSREISLQKGINSVRVECIQPEKQRLRMFIVFSSSEKIENIEVPELKWFRGKCLHFDIYPGQKIQGYFKISTPPGFVRCRVKINGQLLSAQLDEKDMTVRQLSDGYLELSAASPQETSSEILLTILQSDGAYKGAAIAEPVRFDCQTGRISVGDWKKYGLEDYSGGVIYSRTVSLDQLYDRVKLVTGKVRASAEVSVNGHRVGTIVSSPWELDIGEWLKVGDNRLEILLTNTLANHYNTDIPTRYVFEGQTESGLLEQPYLLFLNRTK